MTNTPMTKEEAFESWWGASKYTQVIYHKDSNHQIAKDAWQACEQQNQAVIAELVEALDIAKDILEAHTLTHVYDALIAKVKGK